MSVEYICDNTACGKRASGTPLGNKPPQWYARTIEVDEQRVTQHACSRRCIEALGGLVLPI